MAVSRLCSVCYMSLETVHGCYMSSVGCQCLLREEAYHRVRADLTEKGLQPSTQYCRRYEDYIRKLMNANISIAALRALPMSVQLKLHHDAYDMDSRELASRFEELCRSV